MPETSDPHRCTCRGGLLLLSPGTALANRWPLSGPAAPHQQCLILNAWTLLSVGVLLPLAMLHRMERLARLSAAGVAVRMRSACVEHGVHRASVAARGETLDELWVAVAAAAAKCPSSSNPVHSNVFCIANTEMTFNK